MTQSRVTIKDVAASAGVSITTVSHVLNELEGKRIAPETRDRVHAAATRLRYVANPVARSLRTKRTGTIAVLGEEIATTPFVGKMIRGAQDVAMAHGSVLLVATTGFGDDVERREINELLRRRVDGVVLAAVYHHEVVLPRSLVDVPVVVLNGFCASPSVPWITPDEVKGGWDAADLLINAGHRRIAFLSDAHPVPAAHGRLEGFLDRSRAAGLSEEDLTVVSVSAESAASDSVRGYEAARRVLDDARRPTGIFCFNDRMAMGVYRAAAELGLRIPQDVSIVGFDDQEFVADGLYPTLTTLALPHREMGAWAVDQLLARIDATDSSSLPVVTKRLRCPVIVRDSVTSPSR